MCLFANTFNTAVIKIKKCDVLKSVQVIENSDVYRHVRETELPAYYHVLRMHTRTDKTNPGRKIDLDKCCPGRGRGNNEEEYVRLQHTQLGEDRHNTAI